MYSTHASHWIAHLQVPLFIFLFFVLRLPPFILLVVREERRLCTCISIRENRGRRLYLFDTRFTSVTHTRFWESARRKPSGGRKKKPNMYNSSVSSLSAVLMETERQRWSLHFQRVLVCSHTGWHWDGARWSVNSRVINKPTVHHRDVRGRRGRTQGWEEGGAPTRKLCLIRLIQRAGRPAGPASFLHKVLHQLPFC